MEDGGPGSAPAPKLKATQSALDSMERKLGASLLSIKLFWGPELEREKRLRVAERKRAQKSESLLKDQLEKGVKYMHKLTELQVAYEALEESAQMQAKMESELRTDLEEQLRRASAARTTARGAPRVQQLEAELWQRDNEVGGAARPKAWGCAQRTADSRRVFGPCDGRCVPGCAWVTCVWLAVG